MPNTIKTRSGRVIEVPTDEEDAALTAAALSDPDNPPLTDAEWERIRPTIRRGRPPVEAPRQATTLRLPPDVLARWRASGKGWQSRAAELLARYAP